MITPEQVWQAMIDAGVWQEGHFKLASGKHTKVKLEMDRLFDEQNFDRLELILTALAEKIDASGVDALCGVPRGGVKLANKLHEFGLTNLPIAQIERMSEAHRRSYRYCTGKDQSIINEATRIGIVEDITTTMGSVNGVAQLFYPDRQQIDVFVVCQRETPNPEFCRGIATINNLVEVAIPSYPPDLCPKCNPR